MKILNTYNQQQQQYTNFGAEIKPNLYLKKSVGHIIQNGTREEKSFLVKVWNLITKDSTMRTFEMNMDVASFSNKTVRYSFNIDEGKDVLFSGQPFINPSIFKDLPDKNFIVELKRFVKEHYGVKVYNDAVKSASNFKPKYVDGALAAIKKKIHQ